MNISPNSRDSAPLSEASATSLDTTLYFDSEYITINDNDNNSAPPSISPQLLPSTQPTQLLQYDDNSNDDIKEDDIDNDQMYRPYHHGPYPTRLHERINNTFSNNWNKYCYVYMGNVSFPLSTK